VRVFVRSNLKAKVVSVFARRAVTAGFLLLTAHCSLLTAFAQYAQPPVGPRPTGKSDEVLKQVGVEQRLGNQIPLDLAFRDESGREVRLGEYFKGDKPVVLTLVYYECPMLCSQVLNGVVGTLGAMTFTPGKEFEVVTVSFDPREGPELAAKKKETYLKRYRRENAGVGWHFLTGDKASIDALSESVGFRYVWDDESKQFAHASAIMVATPRGRLSHYFYGIEYSPKDLRLALVEASEGKIGSPVDALILYCYHYDPATGRFAPVMAVLRVAGVLSVLGLAALLYYLTRRARRKEESWEEELNVGV
jgi:protein SCO1/2